MTVTPTYPGLYIQELPSSSHAIVPAPTSIAAFVGYVHPYKNPGFDSNGLTPVIELFSFRDYETYFGGAFSSGLTDAALPRAVYQFFLNGGSTAYVCGLQPGYVNGGTPVRLGGATGSVITGDFNTAGGGGITFTALEPTDAVPMVLNITNIRNDPATSNRTMFDLVVTYGSRVETYRGLILPAAVGADDFPQVNKGSALVRMSPKGGNWGTALPADPITQPTVALSPAPGTPTTSFISADFLAAFEENGPLDNIEIFNLLLVPGVCDSSVLAAAMAFAERKRAFAIIDPPPQAPAFGVSPPDPIDTWMKGPAIPRSQNAAIYFPYLKSNDLLAAEENIEVVGRSDGTRDSLLAARAEGANMIITHEEAAADEPYLGAVIDELPLTILAIASSGSTSTSINFSRREIRLRDEGVSLADVVRSAVELS